MEREFPDTQRVLFVSNHQVPKGREHPEFWTQESQQDFVHCNTDHWRRGGASGSQESVPGKVRSVLCIGAVAGQDHAPSGLARLMCDSARLATRDVPAQCNTHRGRSRNFAARALSHSHSLSLSLSLTLPLPPPHTHVACGWSRKSSSACALPCCSGPSFGEPLVQVISPRGPFEVTRKLAMRDEPDIKFRCSRNVQCSRASPDRTSSNTQRSYSNTHTFLGFSLSVLSSSTHTHSLACLLSMTSQLPRGRCAAAPRSCMAPFVTVETRIPTSQQSPCVCALQTKVTCLKLRVFACITAGCNHTLSTPLYRSTAAAALSGTLHGCTASFVTVSCFKTRFPSHGPSHGLCGR